MREERVLVVSKDPTVYVDAIRGRVPEAAVEVCGDPRELGKLLREFCPSVALVSKIATPFPREELFSCASIEWIQAASAGIDHLLPLDARVTVTSASGIHDPVLADYVLCSVLLWNLHFPLFFQQQRERSWKSRELLPTSESTLSILGLGSIGTLTARKAKALGMRVIGIKARPEMRPEGVDEVHGVERLVEVAGRSDFLALTLPLTPSTRGLVSETVIRAMKPGSVLINISRGGIVDEPALVKALSEGHLRGAVMDVFAEEPLPKESGLWDAPNLVITPHTGDIRGWRERVAARFLENLERWRAGTPLRNVVDPVRGY